MMQIKRSRLPAVLILVALLGLALAPMPVSAAPQERYFRLQAGNFAYTPGVLKVNPGDHVTIDLVSTDVTHGIYIDGYGLQTEAEPGQTARISFTADRAGSFRIRCSVTCGALHPFMIGKLEVGYNALLLKTLGLALLITLGAGWLIL